MINPHDFPIIHHPLEDDPKLSFSFIWNYHTEDDSIRCNLPIWGTDVIIRPLAHIEKGWMLIVNNSFYQVQGVEVADLLSIVETRLSYQLAMFLANHTNLLDLVYDEGNQALAETILVRKEKTNMYG